MDAYAVIDLQFGSTGKGLFCGHLAEDRSPDTVVSAWGPNAGHTCVWADGRIGRKAVVTMLPIGAHFRSCKWVLIGPGAVIDIDKLLQEIAVAYEHFNTRFSVVIHPNAAVVTQQHRDAETSGSNIRIGSTMKGTGAAVIDKIRRDPDSNCLVMHNTDKFFRSGSPVNITINEIEYNTRLDFARVLQIEGAQGFSLGINREFWPYTTSREVTPAQLFSDCAIPNSVAKRTQVFGCARTYPIRVANRGTAGTSGPPYYDQTELSWEELGMAPELTTVTRLPRRIFTWSRAQIRDAVRMCSPDGIFLNFVNYIKEGTPDGDNLLDAIISDCQDAGAPVMALGRGPSMGDITRMQCAGWGVNNGNE